MKNSKNNKEIKISPVKVYLNCEIDKSRIFSENRGKVAIYR